MTYSNENINRQKHLFHAMFSGEKPEIFYPYPGKESNKKEKRTSYFYSSSSSIKENDITDYKDQTRKFHNYNCKGFIKVFSTAQHFFMGALCDTSA